MSWAWLTYISVSLLAMFITADKEAALIFVMLFGHYPILRMYLNKLKLKGLRYFIKAAVFNICAVAYFYTTVFLFGIDQMLDEMNEIGRYGGLAFLGLGNLIFVLYDFNLEATYTLYIKRLMPVFFKGKR